MSIYYCQLNAQNVVIGVSELSGKVENQNMIEIDNYDTSLIGKKYENGQFIEIPKTKEVLLGELKQEYLQLINEADLLGDLEEKTRLQQEYLQKKAEIENG